MPAKERRLNIYIFKTRRACVRSRRRRRGLYIFTFIPMMQFARQKWRRRLINNYKVGSQRESKSRKSIDEGTRATDSLTENLR